MTNTSVELSLGEYKLERLNDQEVKLTWCFGSGVVNIYRSTQPLTELTEANTVVAQLAGNEWIDTYALAKERVYYTLQHLETGIKVTVAERALKLDEVGNFRDMGGYIGKDNRRVQWGKLFRSADMKRATEEDIQQISNLQIGWICDLRTETERTINQTPQFGSELNEHFSLMASANPEDMMKSHKIDLNMLEAMNREMVHRTDVVTKFAKRLLSFKGAPILFHCAAGKDRTGFIGAFLLKALGVEEADIKKDYGLTNQFLHEIQRGMDESDEVFAEVLQAFPQDVLRSLLEARENYIAAAFDEINVKYGNFDIYWKEGLGLTEEERLQLQAYYLE